jgi:hypothetical protein
MPGSVSAVCTARSHRCRGWGRTLGPGAESARPRGPWRQARGLGSWGAQGAGAGPLGATSRNLGESSSAPRGRGPLFGVLITPERLPRAFCGRGGAGGLGAGGSSELGLPSPPLSPHLRPSANGAQPAWGLSGVSRPEPISAQSAFPKSCKQPPWPVLERGGSWVGRGRWGRGWGHPPYRSLPWMWLPWQRG